MSLISPRTALFVFALGAVTSAELSAQHAATVKKYCFGCHNSSLKAGNFVIDPTGVDGDIAAGADAWEKVVRKLRTRSMPPVGAPRPDDRTSDALLASLETRLDQAAAARPNPGRTDSFRRLNRAEYQNAIRDLLALDVDVTPLLPADESSHGFDNITVGNLSPTLLESYLTAARKVARLAVGRPTKAPGGDTVFLPPDLTQEDQLDELPLGTRGGTALRYTFPVDGQYEIQIRLQRDRNEHVEGLYDPQQVELLIDGERVKLFDVQPPKAAKDHAVADAHLNARVAIKAGPHTVAAAFPRQNGVLLETERQPWQAHFNMDRHPRPQIALFSLTVNGPYESTGPGDTPSRRRIFVCRPASAKDEDACASKILASLMRRAVRRPVEPGDLVKPLQLYREGRADGGFEAGIEMALRAVLMTPEFLFRVEQDPAGVKPGSAYRVSDLELASRLSFFLWSSIPDDELLEVASKGKLRDPGVLEAQTRRMLKDPRASALVHNFGEQWLYLRNLASASPDMRLFPDFDDNLRRSFRKETLLFLDSVMRDDHSILDLIRADYTFVNERLAKHYGIPNVYGSRFRKVNFDGRGGLLRQGSILTVTSYATRTSPVLRGKWVLDNILGVPPPPPPAAVPALKENSGGPVKGLSIRERLAMHRDKPACSGCHQLMDPIGFALEHYDAVGRWRTLDDGNEIDAAGMMFDGSKFDSVETLQQALLKRPGNFAFTFTSKLMTYALGRGVEHFDAPSIRAIVRDTESRDFRFSSFVLGIVNSAPFQMRRSQS